VTALLIFLSLLSAISPGRLFSIFSPARGEAKKGVELHRQGRFGEAARRFESAAAKDPLDPAWRLDLGTALGAAGDRQKAQAPLAAAARSGDRRVAADALYQEGTLALEEKRYSEAVDVLRESLMRDPMRSDAKRNYEIALRAAEGAQRDATHPPGASPPPPPPSPGKPQAPPRPTPPLPGDDPEFEKRSGMTRREAEALLRSLDAEQRQRERTAPAVTGKDW